MALLWQYKFLILAGILAGVFMWQRSTIKTLNADNDKLTTANAAYVVTLKTVRESAASQIAALEAETADSATRKSNLNNVIRGVNNNDETVNCPVPDFMRNAFELM